MCHSLMVSNQNIQRQDSFIQRELERQEGSMADTLLSRPTHTFFIAQFETSMLESICAMCCIFQKWEIHKSRDADIIIHHREQEVNSEVSETSMFSHVDHHSFIRCLTCGDHLPLLVDEVGMGSYPSVLSDAGGGGRSGQQHVHLEVYHPSSALIPAHSHPPWMSYRVPLGPFGIR